MYTRFPLAYRVRWRHFLVVIKLITKQFLYYMSISAVEVATCVESVATAWHAVKRANFNRGDTVLILGGGPVSPLNHGVTMGIDPILLHR